MQDKQTLDTSDEISLVDLFITIWDRRWLVFATFVVFVSVGVAYALLAPEIYKYNTVIEVGTTLRNIESGDPVVIEEPLSLLEKLKTSYIPIALDAFVGGGDSKINNPGIDASSPKNSQLLVLKSQGLLEHNDSYQVLHQALVDLVTKDHRDVLSSARRELSASVAKSKIRLAELENPTLIKVAKSLRVNEIQDKKRDLDELKTLQKVQIFALEARVAGEKAKLEDLTSQAKLIDIQLELTEKERLLIERQAEEVSTALAGVKTGRKLAAESVDEATKALTLMMVENQIEMQRTRLERLETRLTIDLKRQLGELAVRKAENRRAQGVQSKFIKESESALSKRAADAQREIVAAKERVEAAENALLKFDIDYATKTSQQKQIVEQLQGREDVLQNTKALAVAMRSVKRVSPKRALIVAMSGISGGMFGVLLAFLVSFVGQVKRRQLQLVVDQD